MKTVTEVLAEMVKMMDDGEEHGTGGEWHRDAVAALAAATAPQPVAGDERAAFEAWCYDKHAIGGPERGLKEYANSGTQAVWLAWQARAAQSARQIATLHAVIADLTAERATPANLFHAIDAQAARRAEREAAACQCAAARRAEDVGSCASGVVG